MEAWGDLLAACSCWRRWRCARRRWRRARGAAGLQLLTAAALRPPGTTAGLQLLRGATAADRGGAALDGDDGGRVELQACSCWRRRRCARRRRQRSCSCFAALRLLTAAARPGDGGRRRRGPATVDGGGAARRRWTAMAPARRRWTVAHERTSRFGEAALRFGGGEFGSWVGILIDGFRDWSIGDVSGFSLFIWKL